MQQVFHKNIKILSNFLFARVDHVAIANGTARCNATCNEQLTMSSVDHHALTVSRCAFDSRRTKRCTTFTPFACACELVVVALHAATHDRCGRSQYHETRVPSAKQHAGCGVCISKPKSRCCSGRRVRNFNHNFQECSTGTLAAAAFQPRSNSGHAVPK